jgi:hypothetical protein
MTFIMVMNEPPVERGDRLLDRLELRQRKVKQGAQSFRYILVAMNESTWTSTLKPWTLKQMPTTPPPSRDSKYRKMMPDPRYPHAAFCASI